MWHDSYVTWLIYVRDMSHSCRLWQRCCPAEVWIKSEERQEWDMSHTGMSHVTYMNESCHVQEWVMSHTGMSQVTCRNESCHLHEWVMSHTQMSHVTYTNESYHIYDWVMSLEWVTSHYVWYDCHVSWMIHVTVSRMSNITHEACLFNESYHTCVMSLQWVISHMSHVSSISHITDKYGARQRDGSNLFLSSLKEARAEKGNIVVTRLEMH